MKHVMNPLIAQSYAGQFASGPMARFLQEVGTEMQGAPLPAGITLGDTRQCFRNAANGVLNYGFEYWEGLAWDPRCGSLPFHHAWLVDPETNQVRDVTWRDASAATYLGVHVTTNVLIENLLKTEIYGVLDKGLSFERPTADGRGPLGLA
ncbi:hypothetical protein [Pseudooceanicola sp. MF1-13]|uniref:hypothetical protein n=1 Tax=Pseudooceanicola sp. MF1-13 TaxID=3379095 RepID=UPI0038915066